MKFTVESRADRWQRRYRPWVRIENIRMSIALRDIQRVLERDLFVPVARWLGRLLG